jgi:polyhydroxybutyrate depolymerase
MLSNTTFRSEALRRGMLAVFPDGSGDAERYYGYTWNAGGCCGRARQKKADDLGFLQALTETLRSRMCLDRLLVTGHSNGAMMAHRWACEGSGPDALFTVSGPPVVSTCGGSPLPTLAWHGTADPVVPFHGGPIELGDDLPDVQEAFDMVRDRNRCDLERTYIASEGDLTCETWRCDVPTTFCAIDGWGHVWPGGRGDRDRGPGAEEIGMSWFDLRVADQAR